MACNFNYKKRDHRAWIEGSEIFPLCLAKKEGRLSSLFYIEVKYSLTSFIPYMYFFFLKLYTQRSREANENDGQTMRNRPNEILNGYLD
jgi:hypothetical protein